MPCVVQGLGGAVDVGDVLRLVGLAELTESILDSALLVSGYLVAVLLEVFLALEDEGVSAIDLVYPLTLGLVSGLVGLGLVTHPLDLVLTQSGRGLDTYLLLLAGSLVLGGYVQDTVGIDIEGSEVYRGVRG